MFDILKPFIILIMAPNPPQDRNSPEVDIESVDRRVGPTPRVRHGRSGATGMCVQGGVPREGGVGGRTLFKRAAGEENFGAKAPFYCNFERFSYFST